MAGHFRADDAGPNEPVGDPSYEDHEIYILSLEAELARVRGERDRLAEELYDDYYRDEAILRVLSPMVGGHHPNAALAAKLAEHDRQANLVRQYPPLDIVDGRTPEQLKRDGDDVWPDGTLYTPPKKET